MEKISNIKQLPLKKMVLNINHTVMTIAGANLGGGVKIWDCAKGILDVNMADIDITVYAPASEVKNPILGLGTVVGSGVVDALSGTATFEDVVTGFAAGVLTGTTGSAYHFIKKGEADVKDGTVTANDIFLNMAIDWVQSGDITAVGTITLYYRILAL